MVVTVEVDRWRSDCDSSKKSTTVEVFVTVEVVVMGEVGAEGEVVMVDRSRNSCDN